MTEKRVALIIASDRFEDTDLRQLVAPAQDAEALSRVLADPAIGSFEVRTLLNELSYKVNQEIEIFFADRKRNDLLLLYLSSHGVKDEDGQLYYATTDTRRKLLLSTAVSANFVNNIMRRSRSRRQVLLLDCCYSGAFARGMEIKAGKDIGTGEYFKEGRGRVVLTASDAMQYAFEGDEVKGEGVRSIFTHTLVQGLETGEADIDTDGDVSFDDLYSYVYDRVTDKKPEQEPRKWGFDVQGKIIIARNPNPVVKPLPPELRHAIESPLAEVRKGTAYELAHLLRGSDRGLALAARETLKRLIEDDSRKVSTAAEKILANQHVEETGAEVTQVEAEDAEEAPIAAKERDEQQLEQGRQVVSEQPPEVSERKIVEPIEVEEEGREAPSGEAEGTEAEEEVRVPKVKEIARDDPFIAYPNGTVVDTSTGLTWAAKDNGRDVNWQEAKEYCENYRGGGYTDWRMPTQDELAGIYDNSKKNRHGYRVTKLIDISACCPWASETRGSEVALFFSFYHGYRYWVDQSTSNDFRALPVRAGN